MPDLKSRTCGENRNAWRKNPPQLCWKCQHAIPHPGNVCPWSTGFKPVLGWVAKPGKMLTDRGYIDTYAIEKCPMFEEG